MSSAKNGGGESNPVDDLKSRAAQVGDTLRDVGSHVRDAAREQFGNVRDRASEYVDAGRTKVREMEEGVESYVQENPIHAVLMAAGIGLLIGLLWRRR
jgi:ElaB/YqjD/DUF883 family membrane-anchored ribosome-binding protein